MPPLFIHSSGLGPRQWSSTLRLLGGSAPALPGYSSPWDSSQQCSWRTDVAEIAELLTPETDLVGHSYGGFLALQLARTHQVRSVAVWEPVAFGVIDTPFSSEDIAALADPAVPLEAWLAAFLEFWQQDWSQMSAMQRAPFLANGAKVRAEVVALMADRTPLTAYEAIASPILMVSGEHTVWQTTAICRAFAANLPQASHEIVSECAHMGPITCREAWHDLLRTFWSTLPASK